MGEEEGLLTKKTWLRKREDPRERVSSCTGPLSFLLVRLSSVLGSSLTILPWPLPTVLSPGLGTGQQPMVPTLPIGPKAPINLWPSGWFSSGSSGFHPHKTNYFKHSYFKSFLYLNKIFFNAK